MGIGEYRKHPAALIQPSFDFLKDYCTKAGISCNTNEEMISNPEVLKLYGKEISKFNEHFAKFEKIKKFRLIAQVWSGAGGELTPTLKLRRKHILEKYNTLVEDIYTGAEE